MFDKILIANRGEIAVRVARTAKRLGIRTVAVYSEADANALHVASCDEAYLIGPAPARESYLNGRAHHRGRASQRRAGDPSRLRLPVGERGVCAGLRRCRHRVHRTAGTRDRRDGLEERVQGHHGQSRRAAGARLPRRSTGCRAARAGGRAHRLSGVDQGLCGRRRQGHAHRRGARPAAATRSLRPSARRSSSFGDERLLLEKYLTRPRHIEMQVFADTHGNAVYLFERDCSVQRRHQKVLEEAPAPAMTAARRRQMGSAAIAAARAVDYVNAGTVEFIADDAGNFYFMEMNTRLQVEHPVTEMITGLDLVEWQLRVAAGEALPLTQEQLTIKGHAIEARIYAEDPARGFLPATGTIAHLRQPAPVGACARRHRCARGRQHRRALRSDDRQADRVGRGPARRAAAAACSARRIPARGPREQHRVPRARGRASGVRQRGSRARVARHAT